MSNLLNSPAGVAALREATADVVRMRIRRWFERNTVIGFDNWVLAGKPALTINDALGVLDSLNAAHDREILDLLELLNQIEQTKSDISIDYYVNSVTGDDINGDGSVTNPFLTLTKAQEFIPGYINSSINVFVNAPAANPITDILDRSYELGRDGQLTIQGTNPNTVESGPFVVNAVANIGAAYSYAHTIQCVAPGWVANSKVGYFVHILSGVNAGGYCTIVQNSIDTLYTGNTSFLPDPGDAFEIIEPGTVFDFGTVNHKITIQDDFGQYNQKSCFAIVNVKIITWTLQIDNFGGNIFLGLVKCDAFLFCGNQGSINHYTLKDPAELLNPILCTYGYQFLYAAFLENASFFMSVFRACASYFFVTGGTSLTNYCCFDNYNSSLLSNNYMFIAFFTEQLFDSMDSFIGLANEKYIIDGVWFDGCLNCINLVKSSIEASNVEGNAPNITGATIIIGGGSDFIFNGTPVSGAVDIIWGSTGAAVAFPAIAGTSVTDGNGSYAVKMT